MKNSSDFVVGKFSLWNFALINFDLRLRFPPSLISKFTYWHCFEKVFLPTANKHYEFLPPSSECFFGKVVMRLKLIEQPSSKLFLSVRRIRFVILKGTRSIRLKPNFLNKTMTLSDFLNDLTLDRITKKIQKDTLLDHWAAWIIHWNYTVLSKKICKDFG